MGKPVVYFDIGCRDHEATLGFYRELFDWQTSPVNAFSTRIVGEDGGIDGAVTALGHEPRDYVMVYVAVEDLEGTLAKATELGGEVLLGPLPAPDGRRFAWLKDVEGTRFGVLGPGA
jgi:hypothetical protein